MHPKPSPAFQSHQLTKVAKVLITGSQARFACCFSSHCLCLSHPTPPLLHIRTVLLELFVSQAVTGSPQCVEAHWLLCSIIHTSFKCMSLQPLVTPCHLLGRLFEVSTLLGSPHPLCPLPLVPGPPTHLLLQVEGVTMSLLSSLPSPKSSHPRNICQEFANSHFFISWGKSHLCI